MKAQFKASVCFIILSLFLIVLFSPLRVSAEAMVGMACPDYVNRGESFKVLITADGATAGVEGVQLYLLYDINMFQFVKANSVLLETAGSEIADTEELQPRLIKDDGGLITLLAFQQTYVPPGDVIAELEFVCKVDAPIGPASIQYTSDSFVVIAGNKIGATTEKLNFELIDTSLESEANPIPPVENPVAEIPPETIEEPFDPANQIGPIDGEEEADPAEYNIGNLYEETTTEAITEAPTVKPTPPPTHQTSVTAARATESPLRSDKGEILTVPEDGLKPEKIPAGFKGDSENILGVNVPMARNTDKGLKLYWLQAGKTPNFYTYDNNTEKFSLYDENKPKKTEVATTTKSTFPVQRDRNSWMVPLLGFLAVSSLAVMIYSLNRNLKT